MSKISFLRLLQSFNRDISGQTTLPMTLILAAFAIVISVASVPFLDRAADQYAGTGFIGVDRTITGSISETKRYTIRRSVLDGLQDQRCGVGSNPDC